MAITTENDEVFGAFTSEPFDPSISNRYYGSGLRLVLFFFYIYIYIIYIFIYYI